MLRKNAILNGCTRRGPMAANSLAVVGLMYGCTNQAIEKALDREDDWAVSGVAAVLTGVMFRSTRGPRAMAIGGIAGAVTAAGFYAADIFWNSRGQSWSESQPKWS